MGWAKAPRPAGPWGRGGGRAYPSLCRTTALCAACVLLLLAACLPTGTAPRAGPLAADHFERDHFLCPHPACLEKKFIVFPSEQQLKTHTAR